MANEVTYTGYSDLKVAAVMNQMIHEMIVDRTDLRAMCVNYGDISNSGSATSKVAKVQYDDPMVAANSDEVTANSNVALGNTSVSITVARQALVRQVSDLFEITGGSAANVQAFANDMVRAAILRFTDMVAALFPNLATNVGTSGANFTIDDWYNAQYTLIQNRVQGPYNAVLAPIQLTDLQDSLRGESGAVQFQAATDALLAIKGPGYAGQFHGIDITSSDSLTTSGSDKVGAMFGMGCYGYVEAMPRLPQGAAPGSFMSVVPAGSPIFVEFQRSAAAALTSIVGNYYLGVAEVEDLRGVKITTSAT